MTLAVVHTGSALINGLVDGFLFIPLAIWDLFTFQNQRLIEHGASHWYYYPAWFAGLCVMGWLIIKVFVDAMSAALVVALIAALLLVSLLIYGF